jgi:hypothetical protein
MNYPTYHCYKCQLDLDENWRTELLKIAEGIDYEQYASHYNKIEIKPLTGLSTDDRSSSIPPVHPKIGGGHWRSSWPFSLHTPEQYKTGVIKKIINLINPSLNFYNVLFMYFPVGKFTAIHTDGQVTRKSVITWALSPLETFSPTTFYTADRKIIETVYYNSKPLIFSTDCYHSVGLEVKNNHNRYSFQICFMDPIEKLVELEQQGKLFVTGEDHFQIAINNINEH